MNDKHPSNRGDGDQRSERPAHTPGPWTVEEYGDDDAPALVIHKDSESRVCFMATPGSHGDPAKIKADARLIAAAPDLLAELFYVVNYHRDGLMPLDLRDWRRRAEAAITKATEQAP